MVGHFIEACTARTRKKSIRLPVCCVSLIVGETLHKFQGYHSKLTNIMVRPQLQLTSTFHIEPRSMRLVLIPYNRDTRAQMGLETLCALSESQKLTSRILHRPARPAFRIHAVRLLRACSGCDVRRRCVHSFAVHQTTHDDAAAIAISKEGNIQLGRCIGLSNGYNANDGSPEAWFTIVSSVCTTKFSSMCTLRQESF